MFLWMVILVGRYFKSYTVKINTRRMVDMYGCFQLHTPSDCARCRLNMAYVNCCYPSFIKDRIQLGSVQILALVQLQNFQNY